MAPLRCALANEISRACGVTRLGLLTGLDRLGLPVAQAVRPLARTIGVHSGKGLDDAQAFASALGEAAEYAAIERFDRVDAEGRTGSSAFYRFAGSTECPAGTTLAWVRTEPLAGPGFFVPLAQVRMDFTEEHPLPVSSSGNAASGTRGAAILSGLLEVVERESIARWLEQDNVGRSLTTFAADGVVDSATDSALAMVRESGFRVRFHALPGPTRIPVVACHLIDPREDRPAGHLFVGTAARLTLAEAVRDSLTEAAQVRLTRISGARDDMFATHDEDRLRGPGGGLPPPPGSRPIGLARDQYEECRGDDGLSWAIARVIEAGFPQVGFVDLSFPGCPLSVVKVVVPGMRDMPPPPAQP